MRWTAMALVGATVLGTVGMAGTAVAGPTPGGAPSPARCDFDADGIADLAIGVPGEDDAGAVNVQYTSGLPAGLLTHDWLRRGWKYGEALACGDFDGNGAGDLVVGAPGAFDGEGLVFVYAGTAGAPLGAGWMPFGQGVGERSGTPEPGDEFGTSLAAGDLSGDGIDDLVVGTPGDRGNRNVEDLKDPTGSATVLLGGGPTGLRFDDSLLLAFPWVEHEYDEFMAPPRFGSSVAIGQFKPGGGAEFAVGAPLASPYDLVAYKPIFEAGRVYTYRRDDGGFLDGLASIDQDDAAGLGPGAEPYDKFGWSLAAGDLDGDGADDLAVGVPFEHLGKGVEGIVEVFAGGDPAFENAAFASVTQQDAGGQVESPDGFGFSLAIGETTGDGCADLVVGAPWEGHRKGFKAGAVSVLPGGPGLVTPGTTTYGAHAGDRLGTGTAVVGGEVVVGQPGLRAPGAAADQHAGGVLLLEDGTVLHQDSPGVADSRQVSAAVAPHDDSPGEVVDGPAPKEPAGEWFGWAIAG
jgi:hypothetical protein